jgi:polysaccharide export outer membrane protein
VTEKLLGVLLATICVTRSVLAQEPPARQGSRPQPLPSIALEQALVGLPGPPAGARSAAGAGPGASASAVEPRIDPASAFQIGPEDILDISVWKNPELSRVVPVRPDGKVSLPLVNDIQAAGLTPATLRKQVTDRLSEFIPAPEVSVMVREVHSRKVAVVGAVKTPGRFELKSPMTVLEVIALAQGFTDFAARDRIVVLRQNGAATTRMPFNYRKIADGAEQENFLVTPGDIVVVP